MRLSRTAQFLLSVAVIVGTSAFIIVVDVGVHAGRIHSGVRVDDIDVGYMTVDEAAETLEREVPEMLQGPVIFQGPPPVDCRFHAYETGWTPYPKETARSALRVGRHGAPFGALADRVTAWTTGVKVKWEARRSVRRVVELIDDCEQRVRAAGLELRRYKFRRKIWRAVQTPPPRRIFRLPVRDA